MSRLTILALFLLPVGVAAGSPATAPTTITVPVTGEVHALTITKLGGSRFMVVGYTAPETITLPQGRGRASEPITGRD